MLNPAGVPLGSNGVYPSICQHFCKEAVLFIDLFRYFPTRIGQVKKVISIHEYWDVTKQFGCPELCCVFCESDDISFSGLAPKINFLRNGTLGSGADCCDFHFIKAQ